MFAFASVTALLVLVSESDAPLQLVVGAVSVAMLRLAGSVAEMADWVRANGLVLIRVRVSVALAPAATLIGAQIVRQVDKLGCLKPGAFADLLVVDGNPLENLGVLQEQGKHLAVIMKGGRFHKNRLH